MSRKLSPNQQKCYVHWEPFTIRYGKYIPESYLEAAIAVLDVLDALQPIFEPTSADLKVGCIYKHERILNRQAKPSSRGWHIRCSGLPKKADVNREFGYVEDDNSPNYEVPELSRQVLLDWIKKALNQECPEPEVNDVAWFDLNFNTVRTKIYTEKLLIGQEMMSAIHDRYGTYKHPLVREGEKLLVYSPIENLYLFPTFKLLAHNLEGYGGVEIKIKVGWSWWTQEGFKEREILMQTIPQIEALGWDLEFFDDLEAAYIPREA